MTLSVGGLVEAGNLWNQRSDVSLGDLHTSFSVFFGADSFLGPIYLGYAVDDDGQTAAFLYVGQLFSHHSLFLVVREQLPIETAIISGP